MDDENFSVSTEVTDPPGESFTEAVQETNPVLDTWPVETLPAYVKDPIPEDTQSYANLVENWTETQPYVVTEETTLIDYTPVIQDAALTVSGAVLFGTFLICGLLISFKIMGGSPHGAGDR